MVELIRSGIYFFLIKLLLFNVKLFLEMIFLRDVLIFCMVVEWLLFSLDPSK